MPSLLQDYTSLYEVAYSGNERLPLHEVLSAAAVTVAARTKRMYRRSYTTRQCLVKDARFIARKAQEAAQELQSQAEVLQTQAQEIAKLRRQVEELEEELIWGPQAEKWEAEQEARLFVEACAVEHMAYPALFTN